MAQAAGDSPASSEPLGDGAHEDVVGNGSAAEGPPPLAPVMPSRWQLLRDTAAFQVKLFVDGARDVLLSPLSLIAAIAGLAMGRHEWFYELLHLGRRSERWIDLFSAVKRYGPASTSSVPPAQAPAPPQDPMPAPADSPPPAPDADEPPPEGKREWYHDARWRRPGEHDPNESIDDLIELLEARLQAQYRRGGMTARAKHTIDKMLDAVERRYQESRKSPPSSKS